MNLDHNTSEPHFRAVNSNGVRRGLRLERIFWDALDIITKRSGIAIGDYIDRIWNEDKTNSGLSSRVRAAVCRDLSARLSMQEALLNMERAQATINASPTPAFLLSDDKRILAYNSSFLEFVQSRFSGESGASLFRHISLTLDVQISDLFEEVRQPGRKTLAVGFALGVADQRIRGRLNIALAPTLDPPSVTAFVVM